MLIYKSYKTELAPNKTQRASMVQHCGAVRFVYNWALNERIKLYETSKTRTNSCEQNKQIVIMKQNDLPWLKTVSSSSINITLRNLDSAFTNFFRRIKKGKKGKSVGFPKFKSKRDGLGSFSMQGHIHVESKRIKIPCIGWVKLKEHDYLPKVKPDSITVSEHAGHWFVSFLVKEEVQEEPLTDTVIGIDLGIKHLATLSDGTKFESPKVLKKNLRKLKKLSRSLSKKKKHSKNRGKARTKLAKLHYKIANIRNDCLHKITTAIAKTKPAVVVMETLSTSNMVKNHKLARSIMDCGWFEFTRQMTYKLGWIGSQLIKVDRFFPSSKMCSNCGSIKKELLLSEREYHCEACGFIIDRDVNAAINLQRTVSSTGVACGDIGSPCCA